jgi:ABC-type antimicrobial peptide transport system permease subunit
MAMLCVRFVKSQLFDIAHVDTVVMAGAVGVLIAAACVAGMIPARKAASIDPVKALRIE